MQIKSILFGAITIVLLALGTYLGWKSHKLTSVNEQLNQELSQANLKIGKAHTQLGEANKKLKELNDEIQKEIKAHKEVIIAYNELEAKYQVIVNKPPIAIPPTDNPPVVVDKPTFKKGHYYLAQSELNLDDLGGFIQCNFSDERITAYCEVYSDYFADNDLKLSSILHVKYELHLAFKLKLVQTISPSGGYNNYAELYEIDSYGNEGPELEITKFESVVDDQRVPHFFWLTPHLDGGIIFGWDRTTFTGGSFGITLSGYGLTENDLSWRFLRLGITLSRTVGINFSPALWNIGSTLPLIDNLWVSPFVTYDLNKIGVGLFLGVQL